MTARFVEYRFHDIPADELVNAKAIMDHFGVLVDQYAPNELNVIYRFEEPGELKLHSVYIPTLDLCVLSDYWINKGYEWFRCGGYHNEEKVVEWRV